MNINRDQHLAVIHGTLESILKLSESKGIEYAGVDAFSNVHSNFDRHADALKMIPEKVLWVYFAKHTDSLNTYVNRIVDPRVEQTQVAPPAPSEPIEGRIDDAILYLLLLKGMVYRRGRMPDHIERIGMKKSTGIIGKPYRTEGGVQDCASGPTDVREERSRY